MGQEEPGLINTAVLRLPANSPVLPPLISLFEERTVPRSIPARARAAARWRLLTTGRSGLSKMPCGVAGPRALTSMPRRYGLARGALPREIFYPARWQEAGWIRDPAVRLEDVARPRTVGVHLWNERIKAFKDSIAPPGSFLARLQEEGALPAEEAAAVAAE
jgi:hypothetical protein